MVAKGSTVNWCSYCFTLFLALVCVAVFVINLFIGQSYSWNRYDNVTNKHLTQITPALWALYFWDVVYGLLIIWFTYVLFLLFRQLCSRSNKSPLFPGMFWFLFIIINVLNAIWAYSFVHNNLILAGVIGIILCLMLYLLNWMAYRVCWFDIYSYGNNNNNDNNNNNKNDVESNNDDLIELSHCQISLLRFLTLNALPLYAMWCTISTAVEWASIFKYSMFHWSDNTSSIVVLTIFSLILLLFWHSEHLHKREYFVWTWLPLMGLIVALSAMIDRYGSVGGVHRPGLFFAFILLIISLVTLILKVFTTCICPPRVENPRFSRV